MHNLIYALFVVTFVNIRFVLLGLLQNRNEQNGIWFILLLIAE